MCAALCVALVAGPGRLLHVWNWLGSCKVEAVTYWLIWASMGKVTEGPT